IVVMISTPSAAPMIVPDPPASDVPPMTTAAITCRPRLRPEEVSTALKKANEGGRVDANETCIDADEFRGRLVRSNGSYGSPKSCVNENKIESDGAADRRPNRDGEPKQIAAEPCEEWMVFR